MNLPTAVFAHAGFNGNVTGVAPGSTQTFSMEVPVEPFEYPGQVGDESGFFNQKVETKVPQGWTAEACEPKAGWTCAIEDDQINWTNGSGAANGFDTEFVFVASAPSQPGEYFFKTLQTYSQGCTPSPCLGIWNQESGDVNPAPKVTVASGPQAQVTPQQSSTPAEAATPGIPEETSLPLPVILGVGLVLAAGALLLIRARRRG
ncbi:MAG: hypothetical protein ACT4OM_09585 [Actinomycetota bacterium]